MKGVCCSCQRVVPVRQYRGLVQEELEDDSLGQYPVNCFVCIDHPIRESGIGGWCEGSGTIPQALVKE